MEEERERKEEGGEKKEGMREAREGEEGWRLETRKEWRKVKGGRGKEAGRKGESIKQRNERR